MTGRIISGVLLFELLSVFISCQKTIPRMTVEVSNDAGDVLKNGDIISYFYNISHSNDSNADAMDVQMAWYLPNFLKFEAMESGFQNATAEQSSSYVKVKIGDMPIGNIANGQIKVRFIEDELHGKWQHSIVVVYQLVWYDADASNADTRKEYHLPLMHSNSVITVPGCVEALGMADGRIKDYQLSARTFDPALRPSQARPESDAWCAGSNHIGDYIQIAFRKKTIFSRIVTWGRNRKAQWVTKYSIKYSQDNAIWHSYRENGFEKILTGAAGPSSSYLLYPVAANSIRIFPVAWKERICLRLELYGCQIGREDNCVDPVGIESGKVPDEAFQDSIPTNINGLNINPSHARLNKIVSEFPFGWMARSNINDWLQIDLGSVFKITKIAIQGSGYTKESLFFVKTYKVSHSKNGRTWTKVMDNGTEKIFIGPSSAAEAKYPHPAMLQNPIYGRYFRITPLDFISSKVMRIELYGCVSDGQQMSKRQLDADLDQHLNLRSVVLDPVSNFFYACFRKREHQSQPSCVRSRTGKTWQELDSSVKRLIGINMKNSVVYGMDGKLRYLSRNPDEQWTYITSLHWQRISRDKDFQNATQLPDILVSKTPSYDYQWTASNGAVWGVSGDGIHRKQNEVDKWTLVAAWQCYNE